MILMILMLRMFMIRECAAVLRLLVLAAVAVVLAVRAAGVTV